MSLFARSIPDNRREGIGMCCGDRPQDPDASLTAQEDSRDMLLMIENNHRHPANSKAVLKSALTK